MTGNTPIFKTLLYNKRRIGDVMKNEKKQMEKIEKEIEEVKGLHEKKRQKKHPFVTFFLLLTVIGALSSFFLLIYKNKGFTSAFLLELLLVVFTVLFALYGITSHQQKKGIVLAASVVLLAYYTLRITSFLEIFPLPMLSQVNNLEGKSLVEAITWAQKKEITLEQVYEYSDMIEPYHIINQSLPAGSNLEHSKVVKVAVSEGPNPTKEVILPNMNSKGCEDLLQFVEENYLSNVDVEFIASDQRENTIIEQTKSGSIARNEAVKFTFSYGEERTEKNVKLVDFTGKSKFDAILTLKQQGISFEIQEDFSKKIKRGDVLSQSKKPGTMISIDDPNEKVVITISKGPKIIVPDLTKMSLAEITDWVIQNKLKVEFSTRFDESKKENKVLEANYQKGDAIEEGTRIKIVYSKGSITMPKFDSLEKFLAWAQENEIAYEERHEFSNTVPSGEVISYSYKKGEKLKNGDTIIVTISDGEETKVPNLIGLSKNEVKKKLDALGLSYNFIYQASSKEKDSAIGQSISEGSSVSKGTTITVTLSNGKKESTSSKKSSSGQSNSSTATPPASSTPTTPSCDSSIKTRVYLYDELIGSGNPETTCSKIKVAYPKIKFSCVYKTGTGLAPGLLVNADQIDGYEFDHCNTVTLQIVRN